MTDTPQETGAEAVARALAEAERLDDIPAPDAPDKTCNAQDDDPTLARLRRCAEMPLTDFGNGLRLLEHFGQDVFFVPRLGWFRWTGKKWQADEDAFLVRCDAQGVAALIDQEVPFITLSEWERAAIERADLAAPDRRRLEKRQDAKEELTDEEVARLAECRALEHAARGPRKTLSDARRAHKAHAKSSGNTSKISNMITEAAARRRVDVGDLNGDPLAINCESGILRLVQEVDDHAAAWGDARPRWTVAQGPHDRRAMATKMMRAAYDPAATCPNFERFLASIMPDPALRDFLRRWFGYTLTGLTTEQKLAFFYGVGRNGKSTLVDVIARIVDDYGTTIPIESLTGTEQRKGSEATPDLVRLPGARLVRASEPERGQKMKEALVKSLTGGEAVMIRRMHQEFVEVVPEFKLTISGNHKPEIRGGDDGIWRRVLLVPFETQVPLEEVDPLLPQKLWAERDGIFAWMVSGALAYLEDGLAIPEVITMATEEYRKDSEPMRVFLLEECEITGDETDFVLTRDLVEAFNAWQIHLGAGTWTSLTCSKSLKKYAESLRGPEGVRFAYAKRSDAGYRGIKIPPQVMDRVAAYRDQLGRV